MISVENLNYKVQVREGEKSILSDIHLTFEKGRISGVIGRNGAGKSTLLKAVSGLITDVEGRVILGDKRLQEYTPSDLAKKRSVLSQEIPVNFGLSVLDILLMGRYCYGALKTSDFDIIDQVVADLELGELIDTPYPSLSGGERQRVQFGRAIAQLMPFDGDEKVLILDEPLAALDLSVQQQILGYIKELVRKYGLTVVMVLHDLNWISSTCDHITLIDQGRVAEQGTPAQIFTAEKLNKYFNVKCQILNTNNEHPTMIFT